MEVALTMVRKLRGKGYDAETFDNPDLQAHYSMIEALALDREFEMPEDTTLPNLDEQSRILNGADNTFLESVYPEGFNPSAPSGKKRNSTTTTGPGASKKVRKQNGEKSDSLGINAYVESKTVQKLTVAQLKEYLTSVSIHVTGLKKAELVEEVYKYHRSLSVNWIWW